MKIEVFVLLSRTRQWMEVDSQAEMDSDSELEL